MKTILRSLAAKFNALTLERRVILWSALVVAAALVLCGSGGAVFLYRQEVAQLDRQLRAIAAQFFEQKMLHGGPQFDPRNIHELAEWLPSPSAEALAEVESGGVVYYRSARLGDERLPAGNGRFRFVQLRLGEMRLSAFTQHGTTLRVAVPVDRVNALVRNILFISLIGLPVISALVVFGARGIARQALAPIRRIADSAEQVTSEHLDRRVPVPPAADEIQRLAQVLNATLDRLENSFHQARRFSADASHELNTPLTLLHADLEALLGSPTLTDADRIAVAEALDTTKRLAAITSSLLLLSRADAGRLQFALQPVDFSELVGDCVEDARIIAEDRDLTVEAEVAPSLEVRGEATRLRQIVSNLLNNALKYNVAGGRVRIALAGSDDSCVLEVANTGPGVGAGHVPHIFDRFYRAEHHATVPGQGLGLSLSRELTRAHGGTLELVSSDAGWTVFRLTLAQARQGDGA